MTEPATGNKTPAAPQTPKLAAVLVTAGIVCLLATAISIPFVYESTTMWYKIGLDRILLRSGQIIGLITLELFGLQLLLAARFGVIDRIVGRNKVLELHKKTGLVLMVLALSHALLILLPEGLNNLPIGWKYWPEIVGSCVLFLLCLQVVSAYFRTHLKLRYPSWRRLHQWTGYGIFLVLNVHVLFVSTSFGHGLPRVALLVYSGAILLSLFFQKSSFLTRRTA